MPTEYNRYSYYLHYSNYQNIGSFTTGYYDGYQDSIYRQNIDSSTIRYDNEYYNGIYPVTFNYVIPQQVDSVSVTIQYKPKKQKLDLE